MDYKIIKLAAVNKKNIKEIKTVHRLGGAVLPVPCTVQIIQYIGDVGFYLFYLNKEGEVVTDTYHDTIDKAMAQAEWEFGITEFDWINTKN